MTEFKLKPLMLQDFKSCQPESVAQLQYFTFCRFTSCSLHGSDRRRQAGRFPSSHDSDTTSHSSKGFLLKVKKQKQQETYLYFCAEKGQLPANSVTFGQTGTWAENIGPKMTFLARRFILAHTRQRGRSCSVGPGGKPGGFTGGQGVLVIAGYADSPHQHEDQCQCGKIRSTAELRGKEAQGW